MYKKNTICQNLLFNILFVKGFFINQYTGTLMTVELIKMLCRDYNLHLCFIFTTVAVSNALLLNNAKNDRISNQKEFGRVYKDIGRAEKRIDNCEQAVNKVADGQVETDRKVVEVLHEVKEVKIKLEEKYGRNRNGGIKEKEAKTA